MLCAGTAEQVTCRVLFSLTVIMYHISQTGIQSLGDLLTGLLCDRDACLIQVCGLRKAFLSRYFQNGLPDCVETARWKREEAWTGVELPRAELPGGRRGKG